MKNKNKRLSLGSDICLLEVDFVILSMKKGQMYLNTLTVTKTIPGGSTLAVCIHFLPKLLVVIMP